MRRITEITDPVPDDPAGASALDEDPRTAVTAPRSAGPGQDDDLLSDPDISSPLATSSSRGETTASAEPPAAREGR